MSTWAEMIDAALDRGWTLKTLSDEVGMAYSSLCDLRRGDTKEPNGMVAVRLHALHTSKAKPPKQERAA